MSSVSQERKFTIWHDPVSRLRSRLSARRVRIHRVFFTLWPSVLVLCVGTALSVGAATWRHSEDTKNRMQAFERNARQLGSALHTHMNFTFDALYYVPAFFAASDDVTFSDFHDFAQRVLTRRRTIDSLEWVARVSGRDRTAFERAARRRGDPGFHIFEKDREGQSQPAANRKEHFVVLYAEPAHRAVVGFDFASDNSRLDMLVRARDTGNPASVPAALLAERDPRQPAVVVGHPVYRRGARTDTIEERRENFRGLAVEVFRLRNVAERAFEASDLNGLNVVIWDITDRARAPALLYANQVNPEFAAHWTTEWDVVDRRWRIAIGLPQIAAAAWPWGIAALGTLLSVLLAIALGALRHIMYLRRQVRAARQLNQYTLGEKLGQGGMGVVYKASHGLLRRPTAIKLIDLEEADAEHLARFEREVQLTSQLSHPNTIAVYDYGATPGGLLYYAMEYIEGITLEELVQSAGPQPAGRVIHILTQVCGALSEAHSVDLIHRDIKPANLMLCQRGGVPDFVKVLDFGLAKQLEGQESSLSGEGVLIGTPLYAAPEALVSPSAIDARSDLYSVGAVGYYMLCGQPVFEGSTLVEICSQHLQAPVIPPSTKLGAPVSPQLEQLLIRCLDKEPSRRPQSAAELIEELRRCTDAEAWGADQAGRWWKAIGQTLLQSLQDARAKSAQESRDEVAIRDIGGSDPTVVEPRALGLGFAGHG